MFVRDLQGQASRVRKPFTQIILNGQTTLPIPFNVDVTNNTHFAADTFTVVFALRDLPQEYDKAYWSNSVGDEIEILTGLDIGNGSPVLTSQIYGVVDDVEVDLVGRSLVLTGRDLSSRFLDTKTANHYEEQTSSAVVEKLAALHGMQSSVDPTSSKTGKFYQLLHSRLAQEQSEWDLLTFLAQQEGYDLWVSGKTLNFKRPVAETADPYVLLWSELDQGSPESNAETLKLKRSQTLAKDVIVRVSSWNNSKKASFVAESKRVGASKSVRTGGQAQIYSFNIPNLTQEEAQQWANSKALDITRHERVIIASLPGDNLLTNRSLIKLVGTNTSWDQVYYVDTITRHLSFDGGYTMDLRAKNHSTESTVTG